MRFIYEIIDLLIKLYVLAIIVRAVLSWIDLGRGSPFERWLYSITEPFLAPIRNYTVFGTLDLSPMAALVILSIFKLFLRSILIG